MKREIYDSTAVFVSGTYPTLTFNDRVDTDLQRRVTDYLRKGEGRCLLVHGASKTGKTVLVERWLPIDAAIWIKGDEISSVDDLYRRIIDDLDLFTDVSSAESTSGAVGGGAGIEGGVGVLKFKVDTTASVNDSRSSTSSRQSLNVSVVKSALRLKPVPLVLDDFHFMDAALRLDVAKAVKDLIRITHVVLIAIPHSSFEPLRTLPDMDWRVQTLEVAKWDDDELAQIARDGFPLLGIVDHLENIGMRLARESRGAPAIMQTLCLEYATEVMGLWNTAVPALDASSPGTWRGFLRKVAEGKKPIAFDAFLEGKEVRGTDRAERVLLSGERTDIYGAVLFTLSEMNIFGSVTKFAIADKMQGIVESAPSASTISGNLTHLAEIAEKVRGHGDPALTYQDPELQILNPFLSFFLTYGEWELPKPRKKASVQPTD